MKTRLLGSGFFFMVILAAGLLGHRSIGFGGGPSLGGQAEHATITSYDGPSTCIACHQQDAYNMFGSVHYQWTGPSPNAINLTTYSGKADINFNTYCGSAVTSRRIACWSCHAGNGRVPKMTVDSSQLANIDCLTCHQDAYRRKAAPPAVQLTYRGYDGVARTWTLPQEDAEGNFQYVPDEAAMGISALTAARTVHLPTRTTCLSCHAYAAGSDCGKRGDLSVETASPPLWAEVHMSPLGQDLACVACHAAGNHRLKGRGLDITTNDHPDRLTCVSGGCHPFAPHQNTRLDAHTGRVACQTCHIPAYAKLATTEMRRDWLKPFWAQGLFGGQGGFKPEEYRESMVVPTYRWFDGTSVNYVLSQTTPPPVNAQGAYEFALPNGAVNSVGAYIYPMKEHWANSALHLETNRFIPHSTFMYFVTGDFGRAVTEGQIRSGLRGAWKLVEVHTFQTLNHGVEPSANALSCGACHASLAGGTPVRMDLKGQLGYATRAGFSCTQCHGPKGPMLFVELHDKHVRDKEVACSQCHDFSRPLPAGAGSRRQAPRRTNR